MPEYTLDEILHDIKDVMEMMVTESPQPEFCDCDGFHTGVCLIHRVEQDLAELRRIVDKVIEDEY